MNNSKILTIKNAKFSGYYLYINLNIRGDFQICTSVSLSRSVTREATRICQFITENCTSFHLRRKQNLLNHQKVSKYKNDCRLIKFVSKIHEK